MTVFYQCKFRETDARTYAYQYDGPETFAPGDKVRVPDRSGDGWKAVIVASICEEVPSFPCKDILGRYEPEPETLEAPANSTASGDFTDGIDDTILF